MIAVKQTKLHTEHLNGNCLAAALASILEFPLRAVPQFEDLPRDEWRAALTSWLELLGFKLVTTKMAPAGFAIAVGYSERSIRHCVVVEDGRFVHDPHPDETFIVSARYYWKIEQIQ